MPNPSCPFCRTELNPVGVRQQWCESCRLFGYATEQEEPVRLNLIVADIHQAARRHSELHDSIIQIVFEQFTHPAVPFLAWRCYAKRDSRLVKSSSRPHPNPGDALRELAELLAPS